MDNKEELIQIGITYHHVTLSKVEVYDGDSCRCIDDEGNEYLVRLVHMDAPELDQPYGIEAKEALKRLCKEVQVSELWIIVDDGVDRKDNHDRYLGYLIGETDNSVNFLMLAGGHAWFYNDTSRKQDPMRPEPEITDLVKSNRLGLFANENAIEPKDWRKYEYLKFTDEMPAEKIRQLLVSMNPEWTIEFNAKKEGEGSMIESSDKGIPFRQKRKNVIRRKNKA